MKLIEEEIAVCLDYLYHDPAAKNINTEMYFKLIETLQRCGTLKENHDQLSIEAVQMRQAMWRDV